MEAGAPPPCSSFRFEIGLAREVPHRAVPGRVLGQGIVQAPARPAGPALRSRWPLLGMVASRAAAAALLCFLIWRGIPKPGWDLQHKGVNPDYSRLQK